MYSTRCTVIRLHYHDEKARAPLPQADTLKAIASSRHPQSHCLKPTPSKPYVLTHSKLQGSFCQGIKMMKIDDYDERDDEVDADYGDNDDDVNSNF